MPSTQTKLIRLVVKLNDFKWENHPGENSKFFIEKIEELGFRNVSIILPFVFEMEFSELSIADELALSVKLSKYIH